MNKSNLLIATLLLGIGLTACNSGGSSNPYGTSFPMVVTTINPTPNIGESMLIKASTLYAPNSNITITFSSNSPSISIPSPTCIINTYGSPCSVRGYAEESGVAIVTATASSYYTESSITITVQ